MILVYRTVHTYVCFAIILPGRQPHVAKNKHIWDVENAVWLIKTVVPIPCKIPAWRHTRAQMAYLQELVQVQVQVLVQLLA